MQTMTRISAGSLRTELVSACAFFCILCGYYLLRPLRDELGVRGGVEHLDTLFTLTFLVTLAATAGYVWLSARVARRSIVFAAFVFVCLTLLAFRIGSTLLPDVVYARALFVWISVINLFLVSGFWSVVSDRFGLDAGVRRFGPIAAGGTAGALAGPALTTVLASVMGAADLLLIAVGLIALAATLLNAVSRGVVEGERATLDEAPWRGLARIVKDPRLRGLAGMVILHSLLGTLVYLLQARLVGDAVADSARRIQVFAGSDLAVNFLTLALQLGATSAMLRRWGPVAAVACVPVVALAGSATLAAWPVLAVVLVVNVVMRIAQFAFTRPGRELLFTRLPPVDRYRCRTALDTLLFRASDASGAWLVSALGAIGLGAAGLAAAGVPLAAVWLWLSRRTARMVLAAPSRNGVGTLAADTAARVAE